jgi:uncharacterized membrane protein (UPF0127 family)
MSGQAVVIIRDKQWQVSLATSYLELAQGLGGLAQLPPGTGMLFDLGYDNMFTVTTEEMLFPIDIIRVSSSLTVTDVAHNVLPGQLVTSTTPARYFLEVNAGEASDINPSDQVAIQLTTSAAPQQVDIAGFAAALLMISLMMSMVKML